MRLVLVHGINNEGRTANAIIDEWLDALSQVLSPGDIAKVRAAEIVAPYYGDALYEETKRQSQAGPRAVSLSVAGAPTDELAFYRQALEDIAPAAGVTEAEIRAAAGAGEAIELGLADDRRVLALLRALERVSPWQGNILLKLLPQAFVYLNRPSVMAIVDDIVRPALTERPCVVVGHSLGTVVTFKLLRDELGVRVPFYLTIGSPLTVAAFKNAIGPIFARPDSVTTWLNGLDRDDAATLGRGLDETTFGPGIENVDNIDNGDTEPHAARMYLRDQKIAEALARAL